MKRYISLEEIRNDLLKGEVTCKGLVRYYLDNISRNTHLNTFLEVFEQEALQHAAEIDEKLAKGTAGRLAGMVIGLKDNICYKNHKVGASSRILEGFESLYSATVVERLLADDAIIIGRLNCDEFAMGASNENSAYGPVLNAADNSRVSGGSSGGAAVAVQADLCLAALGSDTGGSIRQPAAFCGVYGLKPTYGRVSRWGLLAYASSFDQIGPITRSVEDCALLLEVMAGPDEYDATMSSGHADPYSQLAPVEQPLKIAYIKDCLESEGLEDDMKLAFDRLTATLQAKGHTVTAVDFPFLDYMVPCYYVLTTAEASSNLARYSGMLYGYRSPNATDLESTYRKSRSEGFGPEVQRRIMLGTFVLTSDYYDAYYTKAQKVRQVIRQKTLDFFKQFDAVILPTTPTAAFKLGEKAKNPISMYLADIFTVQANLAGNPAISIPLGNNSEGMPIGLQIMTNLLEEHKLLSLAKYFETLIVSETSPAS